MSLRAITGSPFVPVRKEHADAEIVIAGDQYLLDTRSHGWVAWDRYHVDQQTIKAYALVPPQLQYCVAVPLAGAPKPNYIPRVVYIMRRHPDGWFLDLRSFVANRLFAVCDSNVW